MATKLKAISPVSGMIWAAFLALVLGGSGPVMADDAAIIDNQQQATPAVYFYSGPQDPAALQKVFYIDLGLPHIKGPACVWGCQTGWSPVIAACAGEPICTAAAMASMESCKSRC